MRLISQPGQLARERTFWPLRPMAMREVVLVDHDVHAVGVLVDDDAHDLGRHAAR
jgi:hypothetical protein